MSINDMSTNFEIKTLLLHPASFFAIKQEEGVKKPLILLVFLSLSVMLSYALSTVVFSFMNPRMTPALFMDFYPGYSQSLVNFILRYIGLILVLVIVTYLIIRLLRLPAEIQKIIIIFCYAQTPLTLLIIGQFLLTIVAALITRVFFSLFFAFFILQCFSFIGIIWMTIIATRGFQEFKIFTNRKQVLGIAALVLIFGIGFLFMQGFLASVGLLPDKLTSETKTLNQSETIFPTPDHNWSQYKNEGMGITFLFPAEWNVNTTKTKEKSRESYVIISSNQRGEKRSSIGEKGSICQSLSGPPRHYPWPLKVTGSLVGSRSLEEAVRADIAQQTLQNYELLNQSPIRIDNRTGTIVHMQLISERNKSFFWGSQPFTMKGEPEVSQYEDIVWVDANGIRYSYHMTSYASGYDQYSREFSDILDSTRFTFSSSLE